MTSVNGKTGVVTLNWSDIPKTGSSINDLSDVDTTGLAANKILKYDGSQWVISDDLSSGGAGSVSSTEIMDNTITDSDISSSAAISQSKISNLTSDLTSISSNISTNASDISNLSTSLTTTNSNVSTNATNISTNTTDIASLTSSKVDKTTTVNGQALNANVVLDSDDISEGVLNLYFTNTRARSAAVINSTAGSENDQAASVSAMKSFVALQTGALTSSQWTTNGSDINYTTGNVGIGISLPEEKLHVASDSDGDMRIQQASDNNDDPAYMSYKSRGTLAAPTIVQDADRTMTLLGRGYDGANYRNVASISYEVDGTPGIDDMPGRITFHTSADGGYVTSERMRITSAGNVGIGNINPSQKLDVTGTVKATSFMGDGSNLTGVSASSSVNTGDVVLNADSDTNTSGAILFQTAGTTKMQLSNAGALTVGTSSSPGSITSYDGGFTAQMDSTNKNRTSITSQNNDGSYIQLESRASDETASFFGETLGNWTYLRAAGSNLAGMAVGTTSNAPLVLGANNAEQMRFDPNGYIGINQSSPQAMFHITEKDDSWNSSIRMDRSWDTTTDYMQMMFDYEGLKFRTMADGTDEANIIFKPLNVEAMRINDDGLVKMSKGSKKEAFANQSFSNFLGNSLSFNIGDLFQNTTSFTGDNGATGTTVHGYLSAPIIENDGSGGSSIISNIGFRAMPVIKSSGASAYIGNYGVVGQAVRGNPNDLSSYANNITNGGFFSASHGQKLPASALSENVVGVINNVASSSGTVTNLIGNNSVVNVGYSTQEANASVTNSFGYYLKPITIGGSATYTSSVQNHYGLYLGEIILSTNGSLSNNYGIFQNDPSATNIFKGKMGIGDTTPKEKLHVVGAIASANASGGYDKSGDTAGRSGILFGANHMTNNSMFWISPDATVGNKLHFGNGNTFSDSITNGMTLTNGGYLGIGTTDPQRVLHIVGTGGVDDDMIIQSSGDNTASSLVALFKSRGTETAPTSVLSGDMLGGLSFRGWDGSAFSATADITANSAADFSTSLKSTLSLQTHNGTSKTARIFIDGDGEVGIGNTAPSRLLDVSGSARFRTTGSGGIDITLENTTMTSTNKSFRFIQDNAGTNTRISNAGDSITYMDFTMDTGNVGIGKTGASYKLDVNGQVAGTSAYVNSSDKRFKENIKVINDPLAKILELDGVSFTWKNDQFPEKNFKKGNDIGLIAQNVQEVFPEAVETDKDGYLSVAYSKLVAPLVEAVKELAKKFSQRDYMSSKMYSEVQSNKREIASLKDENEKLKSENKEMKEAMCEIKPSLKICQ